MNWDRYIINPNKDVQVEDDGVTFEHERQVCGWNGWEYRTDTIRITWEEWDAISRFIEEVRNKEEG